MNLHPSKSVWYHVAAIIPVVAALYIFPGAGVWPQMLKYLGIWAVTAVLYRRLCPVDRIGHYTLLTFWVMLSVGVTLNIWYFTTYSGGSLSAPVLKNDDAATAWAQMMAELTGTNSTVSISRRGYGTLLAALCGYGSPDIAGLLCINMLATLLSIILTGAATQAMVRSDTKCDSSRVCSTAMIMTGGMSYFLITGTILIKDAMCCLTMATVLYALFGHIRPVWRYSLLPAAAVVAAVIRPNLLIFICMASLLSLYGIGSRRTIRPTVAYCLLLAALFVWQSHSGYAAAAIDTSDFTTNFQLSDDNTNARLNAYSQVGGDYERAGNIKKLIMLPFSLAVQFLTPLPWAFGRDIVFGPAVAWAHNSIPWYALGGILLFYLFFRLCRSPKPVMAAFIFAVAAWLCTAFVTGGTVSRYCLPWLPFMVPAAAWVICSGQWRSRAFRMWGTAYVIALAIGLIIVFHCLNIYSPGGWEAS